MAFMRRAVEKRTLATREKEDREREEVEAAKREQGEEVAAEPSTAAEEEEDKTGPCKIVYLAAAQLAPVCIGRMSFKACNPLVDELKSGGAGAAAAAEKKKRDNESAGVEVSDLDMTKAFRRGADVDVDSPVQEPQKKRRKL
eukprot:gene7783-974_t